MNGHGANGHAAPRNGKHRPPSPTDAWLVRPEWVTQEAPALPERLSGSWLIVSDNAIASLRLQGGSAAG